jgi:hypothetical protein
VISEMSGFVVNSTQRNVTYDIMLDINLSDISVGSESTWAGRTFCLWSPPLLPYIKPHREMGYSVQ